MWYQKLQVSCMVAYKDEGPFEPTTEMLIRGKEAQSLNMGGHVSLPH